MIYYVHDQDRAPLPFRYRHNAERYVAEHGGTIQPVKMFFFDHKVARDLSIWEQAMNDIESGQLRLWE